MLGLANVPAFFEPFSIKAIEISLPTYTDFYLNNVETDATCVAESISYYDEHGHKLLLLSNSCQETVRAYREGTRHFIKVSLIFYFSWVLNSRFCLNPQI